VIDLAAAFRIVVAALDDSGAPYVVVGSTAAASWGVLRATRDIDVVTIVERDVGNELIARLGRDDVYVPVEDAWYAVENGGAFNVLHPSSGGKVDVFVRLPDDAFARSRLDRRVRAEILGVATWVATPEDVILATLHWRLESRSEVQLRNCVEIAATQPLGLEYMRMWADRLGVADDLEDLFDRS